MPPTLCACTSSWRSRSRPLSSARSVAFPKKRIHSRLVNTFVHFAREQFAAAEAHENEVAAAD